MMEKGEHTVQDYGALTDQDLQRQKTLEKHSFETTEPRHLFLGIYPLTYGVQVIGALHLVLAVVCIACTSSVLPFKVFNIEIFPTLQVFVATWLLIGIAVIVGALIATVTNHRTAIKVYMYYLLATTLLLLALLGIMVWEDSECAMVDKGSSEAERVGIAFPCAMLSAMCFFGVLALFGMFAYATFIVSELNDMKSERAEAERVLLKEDMRKFGKELAFKEQLKPKTVFTSKPYKMNPAHSAHAGAKAWWDSKATFSGMYSSSAGSPFDAMGAASSVCSASEVA